MAKYIITTNLERLPAEVLSVLVEAGCTLEKVKVNNAETSETSVPTPAPANIKSELIAALMILKTSTYTRYEANCAIDHIGSGKYQMALTDIKDMATFQDSLKRNDPELYDAFLKASRLIGQLI